MQTLPDFWRAEIWHPLSVHFPIVLLSLSAILFCLILPFIKNGRAQWEIISSVCLYAGTLTAWLAIYTGNLADGAVSRHICDPTVLKTHENAAYALVWIFTVAGLLQLARQFQFSDKIRKNTLLLLFPLLLTGLGFVMYTGHLGATLVYQQGAGVYHPSENCEEFLEE